MKSLKRVFDKVQKENPGWGAYIVFANTVRGRNFSHDRIARMFNLLVDRSEYLKSEKIGLLKYLYSINKPLNRTKKGSILPHTKGNKNKIEIDAIQDIISPLNEIYDK